MNLEISLLSIIDILSIATSFMLGLLFLTIKSGNKKANVFLGLFLWSLSLEILGSFLSIFFEDEHHLFIEPLNTSFFTILFLFFYVHQTINNPIKKWYLLLFIPGILINVVSIFFGELDLDFFYPLDYLFNISLLLLMLKSLNFHKKKVSDFYSDLEHKTLAWIKTIIFIYLGFYCLWIIEDLISFQNEHYLQYFASLSAILTFFMVYWIGYNGFSQNEIFTASLFQIHSDNEHISLKKENQKELQKFQELSKIILDKKLFVNTELNLRILSKQLNIKEKELSKLINQYSKTNFYQFINKFRVEEFKKLIHTHKAEQLSIIGLAQEAGFSSKSTFYTAFKSIEGISPKEYQLRNTP